MQIKGRSTSESLPEILDKALRRVRAGDSVEACLADYPQHARALEPLLRAGNLLRAEANTPLPPEMEDWLAMGQRDFAAIAAQLAPKYAGVARGHTAAGTEATTPPQSIAEILDQGLTHTRAGVPVDAYLADAPDHAAELEPLLRAGNLLRAEANTPLPPDLEAWL
ncbi:MAG TPA: hypothetical protein VF909_21190, partial [Roseiflexaceae bacterium]